MQVTGPGYLLDSGHVCLLIIKLTQLYVPLGT
ncbi:hypothetical protein CLV60_1087 [Dyadobacter jiangsuensis]|uniref:Uncharacterized protein n=1 Tax=Dyadobacter jiangsuensis TaxID=1591085 RepID=A0A2P8FZK7_9BACT|nr:hypothetical protein CLV60_1087 [Dyadobacter jiangsuensis]